MTRLKLKRHYKLLVLLTLVAALLIAGMGDQRLMSYSVQDTQPMGGLAAGYSHALAALVDAAAGGIHIPGTVQTLGVLSSR